MPEVTEANQGNLWVAAWLSGSMSVSINEVTLCRRARLVLGWVLWAAKPPRFVTSHLGQLSLLPLAGLKMGIGQSAVTLCSWGVKAGMVLDKRVGDR